MNTETEAGTTDRGTTAPSSSINPESVRTVAKKDFQDSVRSWLFWGLSVFFFTLLVATTGAVSYFGEDLAAQGATTDVLVGFVSEITRLVIPLIALVLGWKAIAGERESGSIKILLSLPHSRKDVLLGKLLGRSAVLSLSLTLGFVLAAAVVAALLGGFDVVDYVGLLAVSIVYGIAYTSIAVSLSSLTRSTTIAGAAMFGVFVLFYVVWNTLSDMFMLLAERDVLFFDTVTATTEFDGEEVAIERLPEWAYFIVNLDPGEAYGRVLTLVTDVDTIELQAELDAELFGGELPFFLQDWFALLILVFWVVVPIAVALYRFDRVDL
ncbi:ABC transporter permease [Natronococcus occultus]|uniref:ABC-type transport system involved in multi-copper enzyme maturation, permease component n=1 Tax=Natronococcus occultus SP4 TaxID=694430 RepID=L0K3G9_9EURY|nr:ABC transporter permease [Natronococcus occultus]AGB39566.1 ABC-type transport system involved in multi-copper enzyme maturation, permease component [Natronococcus occultus SP4]